MSIHLTQQLKRAMQDDPGKCVLLVGAGLSASDVRKGGKGLPNWDTLIQHMIDDLRDSERCDVESLKKLDELLKAGRHLEVAKFFKQYTRADQFASFLKVELDPIDIETSKLHQVILATRFRGLITTNFDVVFESNSDALQPLVYPQFLEDPSSIQRSDRFFIKVHGCIRLTPNPASNLVLTEESYVELRKNQKYRAILQSLFLTQCVLTVGFSLRDPDFLGLLDDLKEVFGDGVPTVYALMQDPGHNVRNEWREKGVEIIPYKNHTEIVGFFEEILRLSQEKHPVPTVNVAPEESDIDYDALLENWRRVQKIDEMHAIIKKQIDRLPTNEQREGFLLQLLAIVSRRDEICITPYLVELGTDACFRVLLSVFRDASEGQRWESLNRWQALKPHSKHIAVHQWVLNHWSFFVQQESGACFEWLLDKAWMEYGVNLEDVFVSLLNRILKEHRRPGLGDLYEIAKHIEGANDRIEKVVFAEDFIREDDPKHRWFKSWDLQTRETVKYEKFKRAVLDEPGQTYKRRIVEAMRLEEELPAQVHREYKDFVLHRLFDEYVQRTHLTLHSSSGLYDPGKAEDILEALAAVTGKQRQLSVLWEINHWPESRRGLISLGEDADSLRHGLFIPLWWRYSSETRVEYLKEHKHGRMHQMVSRTGQEFLLEDMMGLKYDINEDFRAAFDASLDQHAAPRGADKYEPRPFQEVWRDRELDYHFSDEVPPELVRRIAVGRSDWDKSESGEVRWAEALERGTRHLENHNFSDFVSIEKKNYVIDNLLGAYFPGRVEIVLYSQMIESAARDLGVDPEALGTIVYIHETVHAFSHIGKDHDGRLWADFSLPMSDQPDFMPSRPQESIAQYYTYKLVERLRDARLTKAFQLLEQASIDVYRAWRLTEHYTLEDMRNVLVQYRRRAGAWPPESS